jgi:glycine/D-amino acid oxidase-like deaminating enzyme
MDMSWEAISPLVEKVASDERLPSRADVVVIGGGIAGVSAAYFLAKKGHSVVLLEKGVVAAEQSSRNWGWCRQQNRDKGELPLIKHAMTLWDTLNPEVGADLSFRRTGLVYVTRDPAELATWEAWCDMARDYQVGSRMLTADEAKAMTPGSTNQNWIGGVYSPQDGRAEPTQAAPRLAIAARNLGVSLHQECAVRGLETTGGRISGVVTEKGRIATGAVLCAAGAWASMFCRRHGINLPQAGIRSTVFATTPAETVTAGGLVTPEMILTPLPNGGYIIAAQDRGTVEITPQGLRYIREFWPTYQSRRKHLKTGIGRSFFQGPEALYRQWSFDKPTPMEQIRVLAPKPDNRIVAPALKTLVAAYPALAGIRMARIWSGWIDSTPDAVPVISAIEQLPGFFISAGFSGHGFGIGPAAGRLAADLVAGDTPIVDPTPFRHSRLVDGTQLGKPGMI